MRYRTCLLGFVAAALFIVAAVSAQGKNFNGKWTLDTAKSGPPPGILESARPASDFTIKVDDKNFTVTTTREGADTVMVYKLDGSDSKNIPAGRAARPTVYNFKWDGDKAVITATRDAGDERTEYSLEGDTLVRDTVRPGEKGAAPTRTRTYFKRAR